MYHNDLFCRVTVQQNIKPTHPFLIFKRQNKWQPWKIFETLNNVGWRAGNDNADIWSGMALKTSLWCQWGSLWNQLKCKIKRELETHKQRQQLQECHKEEKFSMTHIIMIKKKKKSWGYWGTSTLDVWWSLQTASHLDIIATFCLVMQKGGVYLASQAYKSGSFLVSDFHELIAGRSCAADAN